MVPMIPYLEMVGSNISRIETEGSSGSLFRDGYFQCFPVKKLRVQKVPHLKIGGSNVFLFRN